MKYLSLLALCLITFGASAKNIKQLAWPTGNAQISTKEVDIRITTISKENTRALFARGMQLTRKRRAIIPMQIDVTNTGTHELLLDAGSIDLPLVSPNEIVAQLSKNNFVPHLIASTSLTIAGVGLGIVGGVFTFISACFPNPAIITASAITVLSSSACLVGALKVIPEQQSDTNQYNSSIPYTLEQLALPEKTVLKPHEAVSGLVFVKQKDYQAAFDITLANAKKPQEQFVTHVQLS